MILVFSLLMFPTNLSATIALSGSRIMLTLSRMIPNYRSNASSVVRWYHSFLSYAQEIVATVVESATTTRTTRSLSGSDHDVGESLLQLVDLPSSETTPPNLTRRDVSFGMMEPGYVFGVQTIKGEIDGVPFQFEGTDNVSTSVQLSCIETFNLRYRCAGFSAC